ncbi:cytochrome P450 89A2-like [Malania oleifera]|uniref:cytochrome P450 89A2-like n=1 Tax=Malania oleifera TaxID=397392 RepID=UPI0025AE4309|nr:cytochrome P450 89A2-like [Malania oleifera]
MEFWCSCAIFTLIISLLISALLLLHILKPPKQAKTTRATLPPGPSGFPLIGNLLLFRKPFSDLEPILRNLHARHGPLVTLRLGSRPAIFVADRSLAHHALIQRGAAFADRPPALLTGRITTSNQRTVMSASYGPTWRRLRRNLTFHILNPTRVNSYAHARARTLHTLVDLLSAEAQSGHPVRVLDHFQHAMFSLLVFMCFGDEVDDDKVRGIEAVQRKQLASFNRFNVLNLWPRLGKVLFRKRWKEFLQMRKDQEDLLITLIRARTDGKAKEEVEKERVMSYVNTLIGLELPEEKRELNEGEMVSLCSEFLNAGTDTTATTLQWIMANLVKYPHVQDKLFAEINGVLRGEFKELKEDDLDKLPYLKAVVLEGLRRHPPTHFVVPHAAAEEGIELGSYGVPKNALVNFMAAEMGWDPEVWEDPMEFRPERFLKSDKNGEVGEVGFDLKGVREIKMMPFGAGRRMCPGYGLAMLHLEYFVGNLVWNFEWKGEGVDLSEKQEFTFVMKYPLGAILSPRLKSN